MLPEEIPSFVFAGKGGVGKTSMAVALGLYFARSGMQTLVIDYDGGHSVMRTLGCAEPIAVANAIVPHIQNFSVAVVEPFKYENIFATKMRKKSLDGYLAQFEGDAGIVPWHDMAMTFFGMVVDLDTLQKFVVLTRLLHEAAAAGYERIIVDVEPTAGLERLLHHSSDMLRSLGNLRRHRAKLIAASMAWPDIVAYLRGSYVDRVETYAGRARQTKQTLSRATYFAVTRPEKSPVLQLREVLALIKKVRGPMCAIVVNGVRGEPHEKEALARLPEGPHLTVQHHGDLHGRDPLPSLLTIGETLASALD